MEFQMANFDKTMKLFMMLLLTLGQQGRPQHICYDPTCVITFVKFVTFVSFVTFVTNQTPTFVITSPHPAWVTSSGSGQFDCHYIIQLSLA